MVQFDDTPSPWRAMHAARVPSSGVDRSRLPARPGIVAFYRGDHAAWTGRSADLRATFANLFLVQGPGPPSLLRRSVAAFLGISTSPAITTGRYRLTAEDHARISRWIRECGVAWIECASESEALRYEAVLLAAPESERRAPAASAAAPPDAGERERAATECDAPAASLGPGEA